MSKFDFSKQRIDQFVERIGIDVLPPIDIRADRQPIQQFYNLASEKFPKLFEGFIQKPGEFVIQKTIPLPGQRSLEVQTFILTPRGPLFIFPRTIPGAIEDLVWSDNVNQDVLECLEILRKQVPLIKFFRIGKVYEHVFSCGDEDSNQIIVEQFLRNTPAGALEPSLRWNQADENYNRVIQIQATHKQNISVQDIGGVKAPTTKLAEYGIRASLDVNNRKVDQPKEIEDLGTILTYADNYYKEDFFSVLRGNI